MAPYDPKQIPNFCRRTGVWYVTGLGVASSCLCPFLLANLPFLSAPLHCKHYAGINMCTITSPLCVAPSMPPSLFLHLNTNCTSAPLYQEHTYPLSRVTVGLDDGVGAGSCTHKRTCVCVYSGAASLVAAAFLSCLILL